MTDHGSGFGRKKEWAITALLSHGNVEESATAAGISAGRFPGKQLLRSHGSN